MVVKAGQRSPAHVSVPAKNGCDDDYAGEREVLWPDRCWVADTCVYGYVHSAEGGGFNLKPFPAVAGWLERVRQQPNDIPITAHG